MSNVESTADQILACTRNLIVSGGYNGFSYADISEVVNIRKASIHHHFPSKVDLVRTLVSQYRSDAEAGIAAIEQNVADPLEQLQAYVGHWTRCIADGSRPFCICALLASELPLLPPEVATEVKAYFRILSAWMTRAFDRASKIGSIHLSRPAEVEAELFMATVHGAMLSARVYGDAKVFELITSGALGGMTPKR
jgi:TetR/AcrR family transcriptional repressor of nem operon